MKKRTHDQLYLNDNEIKYKESFKLIVSHLPKFTVQSSSVNLKPSLLDVGCSNGSLLKTINNLRPNEFDLNGTDIVDDLLTFAKKQVPSAKFFKEDISKKSFEHNEKYDVIILSGVLSIFDELETCFENLIKLKKEDGILLIFSSCNPQEFDVITKIKKVGSSQWESGFNRFSVNSIVNTLNKLDQSSEVIPFEIPIDLPKQNDPLRSYTTFVDGKRILRNGLEMFCTQFLFKVYKK